MEELKKFVETELIPYGKKQIKEFGFRSSNGYIDMIINEYENKYGEIDWYKD